MRNFDQPSGMGETQQPESQKIEALRGRLHFLKSILQFSHPDQSDITRELDGIRRGIETIKSIVEEPGEPISPETKESLVKLEGLLEYYIFLGEKNPVLKKSLKRSLLNAGVAEERNSLAELHSYISKFIGNIEIS